MVANGCDEHGPLRAHSHTTDRWPGARPRWFPRRLQHIGQRGNLRSGAGHLVADGLHAREPQRQHDHVATRWSGARHRRRQRRFLRRLERVGQRGNLRSGAGHLVADRFDGHDAVRPQGHAAARRPGARQRGARQAGAPQRGGIGSNTSASAEIYDPALGTWSQTGSMTADARTAHRHFATRRPRARQRGWRRLHRLRRWRRHLL